LPDDLQSFESAAALADELAAAERKQAAEIAEIARRRSRGLQGGGAFFARVEKVRLREISLVPAPVDRSARVLRRELPSSMSAFGAASNKATIVEGIAAHPSVYCFLAPVGSFYPACASDTPISARVPHRSGLFQQSWASAAQAKPELSADLGPARVNPYR
jgi:hypothetical protein